MYNKYSETTYPENSNHLPNNNIIRYIDRNELVNGITHLAGAILSIPGLYLLIKSAHTVSLTGYLSLWVFGISLLLLYSASATYHLLDISEKCNDILHRLDHTMIYILIAGTYTPMCILALQGIWGPGLLTAIWLLALGGITIKNLWFNAPRWLSTSFYVLMGWLVVIAIYPLSKTVSLNGIFWLVAGGVFYTVGAVLYALKWPTKKYSGFGFHEIFHLFVLSGSLAHYYMILKYVIPA